MSRSKPDEAIVHTREAVSPSCESQTAKPTVVDANSRSKPEEAIIQTLDSQTAKSNVAESIGQTREVVNMSSESQMAKSSAGEAIVPTGEVVCRSSEAKSTDNDGKYDDSRIPQIGDKCRGKECERFYEGEEKWSFKKVKNYALSDKSYMKSPVESSTTDRFRCELCEQDPIYGHSHQHHWKHDDLSRSRSCCSKPRLCRKWMRWCGTPEMEYYVPGARKYNPIWTGDNIDQIGIFIRNLTVHGIDVTSKTISVQFFLNIVWLDEGFCDWTIKQNQKTFKALGDEWYMQLRTKDYEKRYEQYLKAEISATDWQESMKGTNQRKPEKQYNTLPSVVIWNLTNDGYEEIENLVSLNKKHIGKNTVYWRRLIRATLHVQFHSRSFPFGYECFRLHIRLLSWTRQHLVLLRTKLWRDKHLALLSGSLKYKKNTYKNMDEKECKEQMARNKLMVDHSFSYIHPDNSRIPEWQVCSVHGRQDQWISPFDNNDLQFRLPVRVTRGMDTQSSFEALIVLKHRPEFVLWNSWFWFTLSTILALLTYRVHPNEWGSRLEITAGVVFVQMELWNQSQNYPRVGQMTALDVHISMSILCVLLQAFVQCLIGYTYVGSDSENDAETNTENLYKVDHAFGWVNLGLVILLNLATWGYAKRRKRFERLQIESRIRWFTGFNQEPLGEHEPGKIEETVAVKPIGSGTRLQVYDELLNNIEAGRGRVLSVVTKERSLTADESLTTTRTIYRIVN